MNYHYIIFHLNQFFIFFPVNFLCIILFYRATIIIYLIHVIFFVSCEYFTCEKINYCINLISYIQSFESSGWSGGVRWAFASHKRLGFQTFNTTNKTFKTGSDNAIDKCLTTIRVTCWRSLIVQWPSAKQSSKFEKPVIVRWILKMIKMSN